VREIVFTLLFAIFMLAGTLRAWESFQHLRDKWRAIGDYERQDRLRRGLCVKCGYDLTGNLSGTCPECGTAVPNGQKRTR
jgi:hypothetical protein